MWHGNLKDFHWSLLVLCCWINWLILWINLLILFAALGIRDHTRSFLIFICCCTIFSSLCYAATEVTTCIVSVHPISCVLITRTWWLNIDIMSGCNVVSEHDRRYRRAGHVSWSHQHLILSWGGVVEHRYNKPKVVWNMKIMCFEQFISRF